MRRAYLPDAIEIFENILATLRVKGYVSGKPLFLFASWYVVFVAFVA